MGHSKVPAPSAVRAQLNRLERSAPFAGSDRLVALLRFIVEETLNDGSASLKESVIGNAVYGREPPYDPRIDSTVRVEARRLRRKLKDHYAGEGRFDPVRISLPTGRYVPIITSNIAEDELPTPRTDEGAGGDAFFEKGAGAALAIMPFRALTKDPEDESFADGLTDELMFVMARAQGLRITSRSTAFQYKDRTYSPVALASELGVDAVLQGTVRREGDVIRVTIEVSDPRGFAVWSDRFDAPDHERMRLQERIAATTLSRIRLDSSRMRAMQISPGPVALEANGKVYRARQLLDQQAPGALSEALDLFLEVSRSAPDFARGHSGIADCYCDLYRLGLVDHATAVGAARPAAIRALEVDPQSVEAHSAMATISAWLDWDRSAAEANFQRALKLGENARAARLYGVLLTFFERHEEAERLFREARAIEPFSLQQDVAEAVGHYQARRHHLLVGARTEKGGQRPPVEALVHTALAHIFGGEPAGARPLIAEIEYLAARHPGLAFATAEIEAWLGEPERAWRLLNAQNDVATCFARATLAAALHDDDRTLDALEASISRRELSMFWLRTDARLDRLRASARFRKMLERLGALTFGNRRQ